MTKSHTFVPIVLTEKKIKRISSHSSLTTVQDSQPLSCQKNRKIADSIKSEFIQMVTKKNFSMKNAAKVVKISYSTAKKIFTSFRNSLKNTSTKVVQQRDQEIYRRASFTEIKPVFMRKINIMCLIGGSSQKQ